MNSIKRSIILIVLVAIGVAIPTAVFASKQVFKAVLLPTAGATARGSAVFNHNPDGTIHFQLFVRNLSGPATGIHIHGSAAEGETAGVVVTLCGGPPPSVAGGCPALQDGNLTVSGIITGAHLQPGITGRAFWNMFNNNMTYVNVHTLAYPDGEARGQIIRQ